MSKYHKGDKFIVDIKEVIESDNGRLYRSDFKTLTFDDNGLDKLQKHNKPTISEDTLEMERMKALNEGRNDAWELARKICDYAYEGKTQTIFGCSRLGSVMSNLTPQEALAKLEAYEKEQNEIKVGDVVERINFTELFVVSGFNEEIYTLINANGKCVCANVNQIKKTGKHIDIQSILEQIKE